MSATEIRGRVRSFTSMDAMEAPVVEVRRRVRPLAWVDATALRDIAPILVGLAPFAAVLGIAMSEAGISATEGVLSSLLIWAGSAQLAAISMMNADAAVMSILAAVVVINARFVMYGAAIEPLFRRQPTWFRWIGPHFMVDQNFVLATSRPELDDPARFRRYWATTVVAIGVVWLSVIGSTMAFGALLPPDTPLAFASIPVFVGLLIPKLSEPRARVAAVSACLATVAAMAFPAGTGLLFGIFVGALVPCLMKRSKA